MERTPSLDFSPEELRRFGNALVDLVVDLLEEERQDPVLPSVDGERLRRRVDEPLPKKGMGTRGLLDEVRAKILPARRKNGHPRFFGYVCASADPVAALVDGLISVLNQNVTAWRSAPAAAELERLVLRWLDELVGFGGEGGVLVSGGSAANTTALACALRRAATRAGAVPADLLPKACVYVSHEGHMSLAKAGRVLGVAEERMRLVPIDDERRLIARELERMLHSDREQGLVPAAVCVSAGTANTGAIDPLEEATALAAQAGAWLHVDGAYGAPAAAIEDYAWMQRAFAKADSLTLDPHKWLFAPLDVGCLLVREDADLLAGFQLYSEYTAVTQTDAIEAHAFFDRGLELSRRARALKVWATLKAHGVDTLKAIIARNVALTRRLYARVAQHPDLEGLGSELSIACFRYCSRGGGANDLDGLNREILDTLVREGRFFLSPTTLDGVYALRICIVNFRTREEDVDLLVDEVVRIGAALS